MNKNPLKLKIDPQAWHTLRWLCVYPFIFVSTVSYGAIGWALLQGNAVDLADRANIRLSLMVGVGGFCLWLLIVGRHFVKLAIMLAIAYLVACYLDWFERRKAASRYGKIDYTR